jgi:hypothetical protein
MLQQPVTLKKLRFLLTRAVQAFGDYNLDELDPVEIAAWRMTVPPAANARWTCSVSGRSSRTSEKL